MGVTIESRSESKARAIVPECTEVVSVATVVV